MGKASLSGRVRNRGNYGHGVNHTLKMAISGSAEGRRWVQFDTYYPMVPSPTAAAMTTTAEAAVAVAAAA